MDMSEDDFLKLIAVMARRLHDVGAADIADPSHYTLENPQTGEMQSVDSAQQLLLMLEAFSRKLAVEDYTTYERAFQQMNEVLNGEGPQDIELEAVNGKTISLSGASDLTNIRDGFEALASQIFDSSRPFQRPRN